jgi:hypothetical protein
VVVLIMFGENCKGLPLENSLDRNERESMMAINPKLADCVRKQYIADYSYVGPSKSGHANVYRDINGTLYSVRVVNGEMAWPKEYPRAQETLPDPHTRFWECEYCNAVNVLSPETMKCQGCSHPITRKAMEAAWEGPKAPQDKIDEAKAHTPKMQVYGPGAEDVVIDHSEPIGKYTTPEGAFVSLCNWRIGL